MILKNMQAVLDQANFTCSIFPASESSPLEQLVVFAGLDQKEREKVIEIVAREQQFDPNMLKEQLNDHYYRIQFTAKLPFEVEPLALNQTGSVILFLNQLMDWPGFELNELTNQVSYRYNWLMKESALDSRLLMTIVGSILLNLDMFSDTIEQIASGHSTFNELLESIVKFGQHIQKETGS